MMRRAILLTAILSFIAGCAVEDGKGRYRVATIGNAARAVEAEVLSAIPAYIDRNSGAGATAGGLLGGAMAAENSDNAAVIIAGIIGGALIGNAIESGASRANATQYVLLTETGAKIVVAQLDDGNEIYRSGERVILVYGYPARLIRSPN